LFVVIAVIVAAGGERAMCIALQQAAALCRLGALAPLGN